MKRYFLGILVGLLIVFIGKFCFGEILVNLGVSLTDGQTESINVRSEATGKWRKEEVEFELYHYTYRSRIDELISSDRRVNELQVNYYLSDPDKSNKTYTEYLFFVSGASYYDQEFDRNEIDAGAGAGLNYSTKNSSLRLQSGLYVMDQPTEQTCGVQLLGSSVLGLTDSVKFLPSGEITRDLNNNIWIAEADARLRFKSSDRISLIIGTEWFYDGLIDDSTKRIYTSVELSL